MSLLLWAPVTRQRHDDWCTPKSTWDIGDFIYTYPLKKAQAEGYFKQIRFEAVFGLDQADADQAIAAKLGEVLTEDLAAGRNHLAMARCTTIEHAKALHRLYWSLLPHYRPGDRP